MRREVLRITVNDKGEVELESAATVLSWLPWP